MVKLSFPQRVEIVDLLRVHIRKRDDGLFEYEEPWSDRLIADKYKVASAVVAKMRNELFGQLYAKRGGGNQSGTKFVELSARLDALTASHAELLVKFDKLVVMLAANRVADVSHLRPKQP